MKKRVGIIRGGISPEYHISLKTGANVQRALHESGLEAVDMLLDKEGILHIKGVPADMSEVTEQVDTIWNALHGEFGEDGQIQSILDYYNIPYTGSSAEVSALVFNKASAKDVAKKLGLYTPESMLIIPDGSESVSAITQKIYNTMAPPWVVKPLAGGGSVRSHFAFTPLELSQFVDEHVLHEVPFLVEQYIYGKEAVVGVVDDFRKQKDYVLPVVEVQKQSRGLLDFTTRESEYEYANTADTFSLNQKEVLSDIARKLHIAFGAKDYSQSEFIVDNRGRVWFIETDTQPHLTKNAPFLVALNSVGASLQEFVQSVLGDKKD